jgi:hypothetical protein
MQKLAFAVFKLVRELDFPNQFRAGIPIPARTRWFFNTPFRLRKLEFNKRFSQTKVCGYKKPNYDTTFAGRGCNSYLIDKAVKGAYLHLTCEKNGLGLYTI